jgi:hypothetical protein
MIDLGYGLLFFGMRFILMGELIVDRIKCGIFFVMTINKIGLFLTELAMCFTF